VNREQWRQWSEKGSQEYIRVDVAGPPRPAGRTGRRGLGSSIGEPFKIRAPGDSPLLPHIYITNSEQTLADGVGTTTKIMPTDDGGHILEIYGDFVEVFSKTMAETLPLHRSTDHAIDLEPGYIMQNGRIFNSSVLGLRTLKAYIGAKLDNGFIQGPSTRAAPPHFFAKKKDRRLRHYMDYCSLNKANVKNRYPLALISEMLERLTEVRTYLMLDLIGAHNLIQIK